MSRAKEYAGGNEEFAAWLEEVDALVAGKVGLSVFDLEDMLFFDSFEAGDSPEDFLSDVVAPMIVENYGEEYAQLLEG